jgi:hypothetical protein
MKNKIKKLGVHYKTYKCENCDDIWRVFCTDTIKDDEWLTQGLCAKCLENKIKSKKNH